ncbi:archaeosortase/exosortase family protein [Roseateles chitinivorans]|uniref:archaeosortase/exosortase family protein n=1 Tax=Roseateles chitinivorans TaxID=2917965 RepID=UPI003D667680
MASNLFLRSGDRAGPGPGRGFWALNRLALLALAVGLALLYVPTIIDFIHGPWRGDRNSHGPIVLALSAWYFYFQTRRLASQGRPSWCAPRRWPAGRCWCWAWPRTCWGAPSRSRCWSWARCCRSCWGWR